MPKPRLSLADLPSILRGTPLAILVLTVCLLVFVLVLPSGSNQMRHPLMGIKAGLELLARKTGVSHSDEFRLVSQQVARLEELFRSWQDVFTPQRLPPALFAVEPVVQRSVDLLSYRLRKLGARLR